MLRQYHILPMLSFTSVRKPVRRLCTSFFAFLNVSFWAYIDAVIMASAASCCDTWPRGMVVRSGLRTQSQSSDRQKVVKRNNNSMPIKQADRNVQGGRRGQCETSFTNIEHIAQKALIGSVI